MNEGTNNPTPENPEEEKSVEQELLELAQTLGFLETGEMVRIRESIKGEEDLEEIKNRLIDYHKKGQEVAGKDPTHKGRIALIIAFAGIYHRLGMGNNFEENIADAMDYARNSGFMDIVESLREYL